MRTDCVNCLDDIHAGSLPGYSDNSCWCCGYIYKDSPVKLGENSVVNNKWGMLTNSDYNVNEFVFDTRAWKGQFGDADEPRPLQVSLVQGYRLNNWNDIDYGNENYRPGGPGICFLVEFESPNGKGYTVQVVVPKDEMIRALALLAD